MRLSPYPSSETKRGAVLVIVLMSILFMSGITYSFFTISQSAHREMRAAAENTRMQYLAEAAVLEGLAAYRIGGRAAVDALVYPQDLGGFSYTLQVEWGEDDPAMSDELVRMIGVGDAGQRPGAVELICRLPASSSTSFGVNAKQSVTMDSNSYVDSYDSSLGAYSTQNGNKWKGVRYANTGAPVASNGGVQLDSNSAIFGDGQPGPSDSVSVSGNSMITGSVTPLVTPIAFPAFTVPSFPSSGSIQKSKGSMTVSPGNYNYSKIELDSTAKVTFEGPATVVVKDLTINSNVELIVDSTGGAVEFYVTGTFEMNSNAVFVPTSRDPADITLYVEGSSDVTFDSNVDFAGQLYAPDRDVWIKSNSELWGAVSGKSIHMNSNAAIHFDENLTAGSGGSGSPLEVLCWRATTPP